MDFCEFMRMFPVLCLLKLIVQRIMEREGRKYNYKSILKFKKRQQASEDISAIAYKTEHSLTM